MFLWVYVVVLGQYQPGSGLCEVHVPHKGVDESINHQFSSPTPTKNSRIHINVHKSSCKCIGELFTLRKIPQLIVLLMDLGALNMISRVYSPSPMPSPLPGHHRCGTSRSGFWSCGWSVRKARSNMAAQVEPTSCIGFCGLEVWWLRRSKKKPLNLAASIGWQQVAGHHAWKRTFFCGDENLYYPDFLSEVYLMDYLGGLNPPLVLTWLWNKIHPRVVINCINQEISGQHLPIRRNFRDVPTWMVFFCELRWDRIAKGKENTSKNEIGSFSSVNLMVLQRKRCQHQNHDYVFFDAMSFRLSFSDPKPRSGEWEFKGPKPSAGLSMDLV